MTHPYTQEQAEENISDLRGLVDKLTEVHTKADISNQPTTPASGVISYSATGHEKYVGADGNAYNTGRLTFIPSSALTMSASFQTVAGLSAPLAIGTWRVRSQILVNPTVGGGTPAYQYSGSGGLALSHGRLTITELYAANQVGIADWGGDGTLPTALTSAGAFGTPTPVDRIVIFDGYLIVSTGGTLNIQAKVSSGTCSIALYGSYLEIMPVT